MSNLKDLVINQYKINLDNPKSQVLLDEIVSTIKNINQFKLQNCKYCVSKVCLMLKKSCLFYDRISGSNYNFYKCKYFKRAYSRAESDQIQKSFRNMVEHLFLKDGFEKPLAELTMDGSKITFKLGEYSKSYLLDDDTYNNIIYDIKDYLIENFGYVFKSSDDKKFKIIQLNKFEIKFELEDEVFIYSVRNKYEEFVQKCRSGASADDLLNFIKDNFKFEKSSKLMILSKEMRMLYDPVHCFHMIKQVFPEDISTFTLSYDSEKLFENSLVITEGDKTLEVYGLKLGGTLTEIYYLSMLLSYYGFIYRTEDLLLKRGLNNYKMSFFKDKVPAYA